MRDVQGVKRRDRGRRYNVISPTAETKTEKIRGARSAPIATSYTHAAGVYTSRNGICDTDVVICTAPCVF